MKGCAALITTLLLATTAALHAAEAGSAQSAGAIRIAKFKGDRVVAVSMTLDDGLRNQDEYAVPLLNKYGIKATFYVIPGLTPETNDEAAKKKPGDHGGMSWLRLKELAAQGHEIANHTWKHIPLTKIKDGQRVDMEPAQLDAQIGKAYEAIKGHIGVAPFTFATPGNATSDGVRAAGHKYHPVLRERCERFGAWPPTSKDFTAAQYDAIGRLADSRPYPRRIFRRGDDLRTFAGHLEHRDLFTDLDRQVGSKPGEATKATGRRPDR